VLDPAVEALLRTLAAAGPPVETLTPSAARANAIEKRRSRVEQPIPLADVHDRQIPGPGGELTVRVYRPSLDDQRPVVVYFHGGGWVLCDLDSHDAICRRIARDSGCVLVSVDYRLAPEHPFPAAVQDAVAAVEWVAAHRADLGATAGGLGVAGDSSGGNLAASVCLIARDNGQPRIDHQLLIYPPLAYDFTTASYRDNDTGFHLTRAGMQWFWNHYLATDADAVDPRAAPLRAIDLAGLPAASIFTAEYDPLRDDGEAYAARLRDAGVDVELHRYDGMFHGFIGLAAVGESFERAYRQIAEDLHAALWDRAPGADVTRPG
jgi:acetyl esterase